MCEKLKKKYVKMLKKIVCAWKSQDFAQSQKFFARSHDRETVTFRNSDQSPLHSILTTDSETEQTGDFWWKTLFPSIH